MHTMCGYTESELDRDFADHLAGVDRQELRDWYNGYSFIGERVYNPFDILLFISHGHEFRDYWFETGTPTFLITLLQQSRFFLPDLEQVDVNEGQLGTFEVDHIPPEALLLQSGYLTIGGIEHRMGEYFYQLRVPNREVRQALANSLFRRYSGIESQAGAIRTSAYDALRTGNTRGSHGNDG